MDGASDEGSAWLAPALAWQTAFARFSIGCGQGNQLAAVSVPNHRIAMVGDSLHTDILGGAAAGLGTILITNYGLLRTHDVDQLCAEMQIFPDWQVRLI